ncbi:efflux RND transporter periplasmic adaptor subunit [Candidatus Peregrinibacteria bacterium]|nr:efflux RND transporter periplasmic adaptor subunit [Candidatus Peregrinibacteria bacterium]
MKRLIVFFAIIGLALTAYYHRTEIIDLFTGATDKVTQEKFISREEEEKNKVPRNLPPKEVEIFEIGKDEAELVFTKSGVSSSFISANVMPQINAKIIDITVEVGDKVEEGDTLVTLGSSLNTKLSDLQYQSAQDNLKILRSTKKMTQKSTYDSLETAEIGVETAKETYENSVQNKNNTLDLFEEQRESAQLGIESAEEAYENAKNNYNRAKDTLEDLEDQLDDYEEDLEEMEEMENGYNETGITEMEKAISELESAIDQAEAQVDNAKFAKDSAKIALEQAKISFDQLIENQNSQQDQLEYAVQTAYLQYRSAISQLKSIETGGELQELGIESQIVQLNSSVQTAELNKDQKKVRSPIDGVVTSVTAEEGNFVNPGQTLITIENSKNLSIKTSVNEKEAELLSTEDKVNIKGESDEMEGKIVSISPTLNSMSKKNDIEIELTGSMDIKAGSFVKITFSSAPENKIFIPLNSVFIQDEKKIVKTVNNKNTINFKEIKTGQIIGDYIEILDGLNGNEKIVKTITVFLNEGEKIALAK